MGLYGITIDYKVIKVRLGSAEMMRCRDVAQTEQEALKRADEIKAQEKPHD